MLHSPLRLLHGPFAQLRRLRLVYGFAPSFVTILSFGQLPHISALDTSLQ